jgi:hypothetical protein
MNETLIVSDAQLESLGEFYCSDFVEKNMPWVRALTFEEFVQRELRKLGQIAA